METENFHHFTTVNGVVMCAAASNVLNNTHTMILIIMVTAADNDSDASLIKMDPVFKSGVYEARF